MCVGSRGGWLGPSSRFRVRPVAIRTRAARALNADFRLALTGTPLENHLGELWSLFQVVFPGLLGSLEQFRDRFVASGEGDGAIRARRLSRVLKPFLLRRTKAEVARDLPARTEVTVEVSLSAPERKLYEQARLAAMAELEGNAPGAASRPEQKRFAVLAALTRLRLLACHPKLHDLSWTGPASKLSRLLELIAELRDEGHRALVFSQFTKHLEVVRKALDAAGVSYQYLDGSTPEAQRRARVEAFQAGEGDLFLISLKAGGTGLNLTGADNVIHLDPWWNPAVEDQATDRAHRIGQTKPVTVYRLVTKGTIEEKILALHAEKRTLVAGVLDGTDVAAKLSTDDLLALLEKSARSEDEEEDEVEEVASTGVPTLLEAAGDLATLPYRFQQWIEDEALHHRVGSGPPKTYPRAVTRFVGWVQAGGLKGQNPNIGLESILVTYLAAIEKGLVSVPTSEPVLARSALRKLGVFLKAATPKAPSGGPLPDGIPRVQLTSGKSSR